MERKPRKAPVARKAPAKPKPRARSKAEPKPAPAERQPEPEPVVEPAAVAVGASAEGQRFVTLVGSDDVPDGWAITTNTTEVAVAHRGGVWARPISDVDAPFHQV